MASQPWPSAPHQQTGQSASLLEERPPFKVIAVLCTFFILLNGAVASEEPHARTPRKCDEYAMAVYMNQIVRPWPRHERNGRMCSRGQAGQRYVKEPYTPCAILVQQEKLHVGWPEHFLALPCTRQEWWTCRGGGAAEGRVGGHSVPAGAGAERRGDCRAGTERAGRQGSSSVAPALHAHLDA